LLAWDDGAEDYSLILPGTSDIHESDSLRLVFCGFSIIQNGRKKNNRGRDKVF